MAGPAPEDGTSGTDGGNGGTGGTARPAPVLGVVSRDDLGAQHLQRWLGDHVRPLVVDDGPVLQKVPS
jgi:hypothetical protein